MLTKSELKIGTVVKMRIDGAPMMTVSDMYDGERDQARNGVVECEWFNDFKELEQSDFYLEQLVSMED